MSNRRISSTIRKGWIFQFESRFLETRTKIAHGKLKKLTIFFLHKKNKFQIMLLNS